MKTAPDLPDRVEGPLIERLARAGAGALYDNSDLDLWMEFPGQWDDMSAVVIDGPVDMRAFVRAVLQGLREPTPEMMKAARALSIEVSADGFVHMGHVYADSSVQVWQAMLDAALGEQP